MEIFLSLQSIVLLSFLLDIFAQQHSMKCTSSQPNEKIIEMGEMLFANGNFDDAFQCYDILVVERKKPQAKIRRAQCVEKMGKLEQALRLYEDALSIDPATAYNSIAMIFDAAGKRDLAEKAYKDALVKAPSSHWIWYNLGYHHLVLGENDVALRHFMQAIQLKPDFARALEGAGAVHFGEARLEKAIQYFTKVVALEPTERNAVLNYANALGKAEHAQKAVYAYQRVLELEPNNEDAFAKMIHFEEAVCDWRNRKKNIKTLHLQVQRQLATGGALSVVPFNALCLSFPMDVLLKIAAAKAKKKAEEMGDKKLVSYSKGLGWKPGSPLRLGYISADWRDHPVGRDLAIIIPNHYRGQHTQMNVTLYALNPPKKNDAFRAKLEKENVIYDLSKLSDEEAGNLIRSHGMDLVIDLMGYTMGARETILHFHPSPIQLAWKGFMGSTGSNTIELIVSDTITTPVEFSAYFTEKMMFISPSFFVSGHYGNHYNVLTDDKPKRRDFGLADDAFVFCNFNTLYKIDSVIFNVWMDILKKVPNSVIWFMKEPEDAKHHLCREASSKGVSCDRLIFADKLPLDQHIQVKGLADLFLDTSMYNAHGTASDILWSGVPMITLSRETMASRVAASLLKSNNFEELIARSYTDYRDLAVRIALNPKLHSALKKKLLDMRTTMPLFDTRCYIPRLEQGLKLAWEVRYFGLKPYHISITTRPCQNYN